MVSAFGWSSAEIWGNQLAQLVIFAVLARVLEPRHMGVVAFANVFIMGSYACLQGIGDALIQHRDARHSHFNAVFWLNLGLALAVSATLVSMAQWFGRIFDVPDLPSVLRWLCLSLLFNALSTVQEAQFRRKFEFRPMAIRRLTATILGGGAGILAATRGAGVNALVIQNVTASFFGATLLWRLSAWRPSLNIEWARLKEMASFILGRCGSGVLLFSTRRMDDLFVGAFLGPVALGFYSVAYRILMALNATGTLVITRVSFPLFSHLQDNRAELERVFLTVTRGSAILAIGAFSVLIVFAPELIAHMFGARWLASAPTMRMLAIAGLVQNILLLNRVLLRALGRTDLEFRFLVILTSANAVGFYFAAHRSILAVAGILVATTILSALWLLRLNQRMVGLNVGRYLRGFGIPLMAAVAASTAVFLLKAAGLASAGWIVFLFQGSVFAVIYIGVVALMDRGLITQARQLLYALGYKKALPHRLPDVAN